jgi:hypothetical protein
VQNLAPFRGGVSQNLLTARQMSLALDNDPRAQEDIDVSRGQAIGRVKSDVFLSSVRIVRRLVAGLARCSPGLWYGCLGA